MGALSWEAVKEKLKARGVSNDRIVRLEVLLKEDGIIKRLDDFSELYSRLSSICVTFSEVRDLKDLTHELAHTLDSMEKIIVESLESLARDKSYVRSFFRNKERAKNLLRALDALMDDLSAFEIRVLDRIRELLIYRSKELSDPSIESYARNLSSVEHLESIREDILRVLRVKEDERSGKKAVEIAKVKVRRAYFSIDEDFIDRFLLEMGEIRELAKQVSLRGVSYRKVSELLKVDTYVAKLLADNEGRRTRINLDAVMDSVGRFKGELSLLLPLSVELLDLKERLSSLKASISELMNARGLREYLEIMQFVGMFTLRLPLVIYAESDISALGKDVSYLKELLSAMEELKKELEVFPEGMEILAESIQFEDELNFIESITSSLRAARLSKEFPVQAYSMGKLMEEILNLYPMWRDHLIKLLSERVAISEEELDFIPERWREWFLSSLEEEGIVRREGGRIELVSSDEDRRKVMMRVEMVEDSLRDLEMISMSGGPVSRDSVVELREELERIKELISNNSVKEAMVFMELLVRKMNEAFSKKG
ncbi:MAG: hypothetical protein QXP84_03925 [Candidatus Korarchaeum sp.]